MGTEAATLCHHQTHTHVHIRWVPTVSRLPASRIEGLSPINTIQIVTGTDSTPSFRLAVGARRQDRPSNQSPKKCRPPKQGVIRPPKKYSTSGIGGFPLGKMPSSSCRSAPVMCSMFAVMKHGFRIVEDMTRGVYELDGRKERHHPDDSIGNRFRTPDPIGRTVSTTTTSLDQSRIKTSIADFVILPPEDTSHQAIRLDFVSPTTTTASLTSIVQPSLQLVCPVDEYITMDVHRTGEEYVAGRNGRTADCRSTILRKWAFHCPRITVDH